jgi:hypothetical protein
MVAFESALPDDDGFSKPLLAAVCATVLWVLWLSAERDTSTEVGALPKQLTQQYQESYRRQTAADGLVGMMLDALRIRDKRVDFACLGVLLCMSGVPEHTEHLCKATAIELLVAWSCRLPQGIIIIANSLSTEAADSGYRESINRETVGERDKSTSHDAKNRGKYDTSTPRDANGQGGAGDAADAEGWVSERQQREARRQGAQQHALDLGKRLVSARLDRSYSTAAAGWLLPKMKTERQSSKHKTNAGAGLIHA